MRQGRGTNRRVIGTVMMGLSLALLVAASDRAMAKTPIQTPTPTQKPTESPTQTPKEGLDEPRLRCEIADQEGQELERSATGRIRVSNLEPIPLRIELDTDGLHSEPLEVSGTEEDAEPTLVVEVVHLQEGQPVAVPVELSQLGMSRGDVTSSLEVSLRIPLDQEAQRAALDSFLERLEAESRKAGRLEEFRRLTADKEALLAGLSGFQQQNRTGNFEVRCKYRSAGPGLWEGEVRAEPLPIEVRFDGGAFEEIFSSAGGGASPGDPAP